MISNIISIIGTIVSFVSIYLAISIYKRQKHESFVANARIEYVINEVLVTIERIETIKTESISDKISDEIKLLDIKMKETSNNIDSEKLVMERQKKINEIMRLKNQKSRIDNEVIKIIMQEIGSKLKSFK